MSGRHVRLWDIDEVASRASPYLTEFANDNVILPRHPSLFTRWAIARARMEARFERRTPDGRSRFRPWEIFDAVTHQLGWGLWCLGLYERGIRNALDIRLNRLELVFEDLPSAFDGYEILHLTDLHIDALPELPARLRALVEGMTVDLCVMTGDYRFRKRGPHDHVVDHIGHVLDGVRTRDGILATLGNHDSVEMVGPLEALGVRVLVNETVTLARGGNIMHVTGVDDVHYFYTDRAPAALESVPDGFHVGLVHSPEFAAHAAAAGVSLYLTGHTHGGQVCLPGGRAIVSNLTDHHAFSNGLWRLGEMIGYTSPGVGVSSLPVRYNSRGEATLVVLRRPAER